MRVFICNIVPKGLLVEFQGSQAANNFCFNLIEGKCFQSVYSIVPKFCNKNISYSSNDGVFPIL